MQHGSYRVSLLAAVLLGCGGDVKDDIGPPDAGAADAASAQHAHDDSDEPIPCPSYTPTFEPGMSVPGEQEHISARLVSASPATPRKFENSWVLEFVDAEGNPISDIQVTPHEPWMDVHGHGGGYLPDVIPGDEPGQLELDRINLKMPGPWRLNLDVASERVGEDEIVIYVCVP